MSDQTNAIQGNQSAKHDADTATRNDSKDNWQSWQARSIIAIVLLGLAGVIAWWDFGFFYKILIAGSAWWLVSAAEPKLSKSEEYKGAVWLWPVIIKGVAILMLFLTVLHSGFGQTAKRGVEVLEGKAACVADSGSQACTDYKKAQAALDAPRVARERQAEIDQAAHDATIASTIAAAANAAVRPAGAPTDDLVTLVRCNDSQTSWSAEDIPFAAGWRFTLGYRSDVLQYRYLPKFGNDYVAGKPKSGQALALGVCTTNQYLHGKEMDITWEKKS
jgi:hypothetical protein